MCAPVLRNFDHLRFANQHIYENTEGTGYDPMWMRWNEEADDHWSKNGRFGKFDQSLYTNGRDPAEIGLREWGFFYYPDSCIDGGCNLQIMYHGCLSNAQWELMLYIPWAASNNVVLVAP